MTPAVPPGLDGLMAKYRTASQAMRTAANQRAFNAAWRDRDRISAQIRSMTGHAVEVYL